MAVTSPYAFCTQADVERRLSALGVQLRLDHDNDGAVDADEQLTMTDAISDATETLLYYCWAKYAPEVLATSPWINRRAVDYAAYVLCGVRCNPIPEDVIRRVEAAEKLLKEVRDGNGFLPNVPLRRRMAPVWSNTRVDPRYQFKVIRVDPQTSSRHSGGTYAQNVDWPASYTFEI